MDAVQPECGQQGDGIFSHVLYAVGRRAPVAAEQGHVVGGAFKFGGEPRVAVVEANGEEAARRQLLNEPFGPSDQLGPQSHDEEEGGIRRIPAGHVRNVDPVDVCSRHGRLPWSK
jgi:hypothetical protein